MTKSYQKNCRGDFIVVDGECMLCLLPELEAPELMQSDDVSCYFIRQPKSSIEIEMAISAIAVSCYSAVMYVGSNKDIIEKLKANPDIDSSAYSDKA